MSARALASSITIFLKFRRSRYLVGDHHIREAVHARSVSNGLPGTVLGAFLVRRVQPQQQ